MNRKERNNKYNWLVKCTKKLQDNIENQTEWENYFAYRAETACATEGAAEYALEGFEDDVTPEVSEGEVRSLLLGLGLSLNEWEANQLRPNILLHS